MGVRLVPVPNIRPHRCALLTNVAASNERVGFFDFGTDLDREHVYVSFTAFAEMARYAGWVPRKSGDLESARLRERLSEAEEKVASLERELDAVEVLKRGSFTQAKKPGRPKKVAA